MPKIPLHTLMLVPAILGASHPASDARIAAAIRNSYNFRVHLKGDAIDVSSSGGEVRLAGTVANEFHRTLAEETVQDFPGVKSVDNKLVVAADASGTAPDLWLATKVKTALRYHRNVDETTVQVTAHEGVVTLSGQTGSAAQKGLAQDLAANVDGVREVKNNLRVGPPPKTLAEKVDDASVTAQVKAVLLAHRGTRVLATHVKTDRGVVTVRGEARNASEKALVERLTADIKGVRRVRNLMTVTP
ncbi:BON domain-containing protein [Mesoterricola silvestris]|uniref:Transporter n=1 Tax=Mesoterricola silvestris TaxID=2927979 RepID=A0AA48GIZ1_9BACT|nr:BON domain-containing protein [Mesoterricola silvestris]BDU72162.1 transporter [Mesoterricola silvestris]